MNFMWFFLLLLLILPISVFSDCTCEESTNDDDNNNNNKTKALQLKLIAIASILVAGAIGVCLPFLGKVFGIFNPENNFFLALKFFAAGVILATGFVHVFADANESLENPCLNNKAWGDFPLANFVAMVAAVVVMIVETAVTGMFNRSYRNKNDGDEEKHDLGHLPVNTHTSNGHVHGSIDVFGSSEGLLRYRIISQVLEVGILIHSIIIGISLGVSLNPTTIKPLIFALSFHQMFEGMGLGSCITEAKFKIVTIATMSIFFSLTTPIGIAIGFGISNTYNENSQMALIVEGVLNAASAGILIYMALVDLLAVDLMKSKVQTSSKLQCLAFFSLFLGLGSMSLLARWA